MDNSQDLIYIFKLTNHLENIKKIKFNEKLNISLHGGKKDKFGPKFLLIIDFNLKYIFE